LTRVPDFEHQHAAHCESGVMSTLLKHSGVELSEPMVFGISGGLCFAFLPFLRMGNLPVVSYRMFPGHIVKKLPKQLGIPYFRKTFSDPDQAMAELDEALFRNVPVGLQTSAYFTTYFPPEMRFHFNAHNIIVVGKEEDEYLVSDPVFDEIKRIASDDLKKARFARGLSAPKGFSHYPIEASSGYDLQGLIHKAVKSTSKMMLYAPVPWIGIKGINHLAGHVARLLKKTDPRYTRLFLGNVVRMQEEIGTGGGGFRFMYASFLQEAHRITGWAVLQEASEQMTEAGDMWRQFALACARVVKNRETAVDTGAIAKLLRDCGERERQVYRMLKKV